MSYFASFVAYVKAKDWKQAYDQINGYNMAGMLSALKEIGPLALRDMRAQMAIYDVWGGPNMERIRFAMDVVATLKVPAPPSWLPPDQVQDARDFLKRNAGGKPAGAAKKTIHLTLYWTRAALGETISSRLIQRAREILRDNLPTHELSVLPKRYEIAFDGEVLGQPDVENAIGMAEALVPQSANRLSVFFCRTTAAECSPGQTCASAPHGTTPQIRGRPYIFINVANPKSDSGTLLHEIGHAAGVQVRDSDENLKDLDDIMSYGANRSKIGFNMTNKLNAKGLFFVTAS